MEEATAISRARGLLRDARIDTIPVDVAAIAAHAGIDVHYRTDLDDDQAGLMFQHGESIKVAINSKDAPTRQRFTVLHEVGHVVLELPSDHNAGLSSEKLESYARRPPEEVLCDVFAAECLLPAPIFASRISEEDYSAGAVRALAAEFDASLPSVASRFAQLSEELLMYVLAQDGVIRYTARSSSLRDLGFWVNIGRALPRSSAAAHDASGETSDLAIAEQDGTDWSTSDVASKVYVTEEVIHLPRWQQTLSLLTAEILTQQTRDCRSIGEDDEDELLEELTGELPWRK